MKFLDTSLYHARRRPARFRTPVQRLLRTGKGRTAILLLCTLLTTFALYHFDVVNVLNLPMFRLHLPAISHHKHTHINASNQSAYYAFPPISIDDIDRQSDITNTFSDYKHFGEPRCNISSLDLHTPFSPLCSSRHEFVQAFTSGGRIGFNAPFMPRGCDMRWFTTSEICEIFSRFEKVIVVGDSMMRHVVGALNVLLRQDLGYGAVTDWNFNEEERQKCFCIRQFDVKACSIQGIYRTSDVLTHDPESFSCPKSKSSTGWTSPVNLIIETMLKHPLDPIELARLRDLISSKRPRKPLAFIFGHGLWNDLDLHSTVQWFEGIHDTILTAAPYLSPHTLPRIPGQGDRVFPHMLFMTPNAAGTAKPNTWITTQGDKALQLFEKSIAQMVCGKAERWFDMGLDHIGTWNMSMQMDKWDGVHLDLRGNLVKAMGVINWLARIEVEYW